MYHMYIDVCMMKVALREGYFYMKHATLER